MKLLAKRVRAQIGESLPWNLIFCLTSVGPGKKSFWFGLVLIASIFCPQGETFLLPDEMGKGCGFRRYGRFLLSHSQTVQTAHETQAYPPRGKKWQSLWVKYLTWNFYWSDYLLNRVLFPHSVTWCERFSHLSGLLL